MGGAPVGMMGGTGAADDGRPGMMRQRDDGALRRQPTGRPAPVARTRRRRAGRRSERWLAAQGDGADAPASRRLPGLLHDGDAAGRQDHRDDLRQRADRRRALPLVARAASSRWRDDAPRRLASGRGGRARFARSSSTTSAPLVGRRRPATSSARGSRCSRPYDGEQAVELARSTSDPDVIVLDLMLPGHRRDRGVPQDPRVQRRLHRDADRQGRGGRQDRRPLDRRRRLRHQAVLARRARGARARDAAPPARRRRQRPAGVRRFGALELDPLAREVRVDGRAGRADAARVRPARRAVSRAAASPSAASGCSSASGARTGSATTTSSTSTSPTCAASSATTPPRRATSAPCAASATGWATG